MNSERKNQLVFNPRQGNQKHSYYHWDDYARQYLDLMIQFAKEKQLPFHVWYGCYVRKKYKSVYFLEMNFEGYPQVGLCLYSDASHKAISLIRQANLPICWDAGDGYKLNPNHPSALLVSNGDELLIRQNENIDIISYEIISQTAKRVRLQKIKIYIRTSSDNLANELSRNAKQTLQNIADLGHTLVECHVVWRDEPICFDGL